MRSAERVGAAHYRTGAENAARSLVQWPGRTVSLSGLRTTGGRAPEVSGVSERTGDCVSGMVEFTAASGVPRPVHRLGNGSTAAQYSFAGLQYPVSDSAMGDGSASGIAHSGAHGQAGSGRLAARLCTSGVSTGNIRGSGTVPWDVLSRGELGSGGTHDRPRQK